LVISCHAERSSKFWHLPISSKQHFKLDILCEKTVNYSEALSYKNINHAIDVSRELG